MPISATERGPTVLIVDNDPLAREHIQRYLTARGVTFDVASHPAEAIARLAGSQYDYLFLDLDLGAGLSDGEGILAWMRRHTILIPTVLLSEAANMPSVIRLEKAYEFVKLRMTHGDLAHLGDVVDDLMRTLEAHKSPEKRDAKPLTSNSPLNEAPRSRHALILMLVAAFVVIVAVLAAVMYWLPTLSVVSITVTAVLLVTLLLAGVLIEQGRLSERGFLSIVKDVLKRVKPGRRAQQ